VCDAGYTGPDCSGKACKYGVDPLYVDDEATARVETIKYAFYDSGADGRSDKVGTAAISGTYALKFYDVFGEDYQTMPIKLGSDCYTVEDALDGLPNTVIPDDSIVCVSTTATGYEDYELTFTGNPGYLKQLFVDTYLDGDRETISGTGAVTTSTYNTGISGDFTDYFASQCKGVYATIDGSLNSATLAQTDATTYYANELNSGYYLGLSAAEIKLLKICLGDADGVTSNDVEVYQWDYGSFTEAADGNLYVMDSYPHAIKLVKVDPYDDYDGGYYYLTWWAPLASETGYFLLANPPVGASFTYAVYTTDGVVERLIVDQQTGNDQGDKELSQPQASENTAGAEARITAYFEAFSNVLYTSYDTACETAFSMVEPCLDKGDMLFVIQSNYMQTEYSPVSAGYTDNSMVALNSNTVLEESGNLYTIKKVYKEDPTATTFYREDRFRIVLDKNLPFAGTDLSQQSSDGLGTANAFAKGSENSSHVGIVNLFKFSPATTGNYEYVSECSNRGTCDEGTCACFKGYTDDDCNVQSSLAV